MVGKIESRYLLFAKKEGQLAWVQGRREQQISAIVGEAQTWYDGVVIWS